MKKQLIISALLISTMVAFTGCSDDDDKPEIVCLPTELAGEESILTLTYNDDNTVQQIDYLEYDFPEPGKHFSRLSYASGKLSKIDHFRDDAIEAYATFDYVGNTIIEKLFSKSGDVFESTERNIYYLQNDKIVHWAYHNDGYDDTMRDSIVYTYDSKGNILHADGYSPTKVKEYTYDVTYDNNFNPYKQAGVNGGDDMFFDMQNISTNNIIQSTYTYLSPSSTDTETITYTYDSDGKPLTRKYNWEASARGFSYECE